MEPDDVGTIDKSRARLFKMCQIKVDEVRHLKHVSTFPSDVTLTRSVNTNEIKNNLVTKWDIGARMHTLGTIKKIP